MNPISINENKNLEKIEEEKSLYKEENFVKLDDDDKEEAPVSRREKNLNLKMEIKMIIK